MRQPMTSGLVSSSKTKPRQFSSVTSLCTRLNIIMQSVNDVSKMKFKKNTQNTHKHTAYTKLGNVLDQRLHNMRPSAYKTAQPEP